MSVHQYLAKSCKQFRGKVEISFRSQLTLITTAELAKAVMKEEQGVLDKAGNSIANLLAFEPYAYLGERIIHVLFDKQNPSYSKQISDDVLYCITDKNHHMFDHIKKILQLQWSFTSRSSPREAHQMAHLLQCWRERSEGSTQCLRQKLDEFSVFTGRNPIVSIVVLQRCKAEQHRVASNVKLYWNIRMVLLFSTPQC